MADNDMQENGSLQIDGLPQSPLATDNQANGNRFVFVRNVRRARTIGILKIYAVSGLLIFLGSSSYAAFLIFDVLIPTEARLALLVAFSGLMFSIVSYAATRFLFVEDSLSEEVYADFDLVRLSLASWTYFERAARMSLQANETIPMRLLIDQLIKNGDLNDREERTVHIALMFRNKIAHGGKVLSSDAEVRSVFSKLNVITERLERKARTAP